MNKFIVALFVICFVQMVFQSNILINASDNMSRVHSTTASPVLENPELIHHRRACMIVNGRSVCSAPRCVIDAFGRRSCVGKK